MVFFSVLSYDIVFDLDYYNMVAIRKKIKKSPNFYERLTFRGFIALISGQDGLFESFRTSIRQAILHIDVNVGNLWIGKDALFVVEQHPSRISEQLLFVVECHYLIIFEPSH